MPPVTLDGMGIAEDGAVAQRIGDVVGATGIEPVTPAV